MNEQKIALVTGANRGIEYAIAQGLLDANFQVIIGSRTIEKGIAAAEKLNSPLVSAVELDIADDNSINKVFNELKVKIDRLDVLINNAGIYPDNGFNILTIDRDLLTKTLNVNTFGAIKTTQIFLSLLEKAVDPGWVSSDMGGENAPRTVERGADTAVWLATVDSVEDSGKLWRDHSVVSF